jgi:hypothetical protein
MERELAGNHGPESRVGQKIKTGKLGAVHDADGGIYHVRNSLWPRNLVQPYLGDDFGSQQAGRFGPSHGHNAMLGRLIQQENCTQGGFAWLLVPE